jgi:hypothetical protein
MCSATVTLRFLVTRTWLACAGGNPIVALAGKLAGRRDPHIYAINFEAALRPENNNTPNAIVSRATSCAGRTRSSCHRPWR